MMAGRTTRRSAAAATVADAVPAVAAAHPTKGKEAETPSRSTRSQRRSGPPADDPPSTPGSTVEVDATPSMTPSIASTRSSRRRAEPTATVAAQDAEADATRTDSPAPTAEDSSNASTPRTGSRRRPAPAAGDDSTAASPTATLLGHESVRRSERRQISEILRKEVRSRGRPQHGVRSNHR